MAKMDPFSICHPPPPPYISECWPERQEIRQELNPSHYLPLNSHPSELHSNYLAPLNPPNYTYLSPLNPPHYLPLTPQPSTTLPTQPFASFLLLLIYSMFLFLFQLFAINNIFVIFATFCYPQICMNFFAIQMHNMYIYSLSLIYSAKLAEETNKPPLLVIFHIEKNFREKHFILSRTNSWGIFVCKKSKLRKNICIS